MGVSSILVQFTEEHAFKLRCHTEEQKSSPRQGLSAVLPLWLFNAKNSVTLLMEGQTGTKSQD